MLSKDIAPTIYNMFDDYKGVGKAIHEELVTWYLTNKKFREQINSLPKVLKEKNIIRN